jgi:hypothetical protein
MPWKYACGFFGLLMKQSDTGDDQNQPAELCETYGLFEAEIVDRGDEQIS